MSELTYEVVLASWCCPGGRSITATGVGVWAPIPGWLHEMVRSGSVAVEDDVQTQFYLRSRFVGPLSITYQIRLRDITNGVTVLGPTVLSVSGNGVGWTYWYSFGPLATWPAGDAALRMEYTGGGNGILVMWMDAGFKRWP